MPENDDSRPEQARAERAELLDELAATGAADPAAPALCAAVGALSHELYLAEGGADDLELAAEAFAHAFRRPGDDAEWAVWRIRYAHVRAFQYDADPEGGPQLPDAIHTLLNDGLAGLAGAEDPEGAAGLGRRLLANISKIRYLASEGPAEERLALLETSLRHHTAQLDELAADDPDAVDLHEALGYLHQQRALLTDAAPDMLLSARHYEAVLDAPGPGTDVPLVRFGRALSLMLHGRGTRTRAELEEARTEFDTALVEARRAGGEPPWWAEDAAYKQVFCRALVWTMWQDEAQAAAAEAELNTLLAADPGAEDELLPQYLDFFGRVLYERGVVRGDDAAKDRGVRLLRRGLVQWEPGRDGRIAGTATMLAIAQQTRYRDDPDPERLRDVVLAARHVIEEEGAEKELHDMAVMLLGWARNMLEEHGLKDDGGGPEVTFEEVRGIYESLLDSIQDGTYQLDHGDEGYFATINDAASPGRTKDGFDFVFRKWSELEPGSVAHTRAAAFLLAHLPMFDPHGDQVDQEQKDALTRALMSARPDDDPDWRRRAHAVVGGALLSEELAGGVGDRVEEVLAHFDTAEEGAGIGADLGMIRMMATVHRGQMSGTADDMAAGAASWRQLRESPGLRPYARRMLDAQQSGYDAVGAVHAGDLAGADRHIGDLHDAIGGLAEDDTSRIELWTLLENARSARDDLAERLGAPPAPPLAGRPTTAELRRAAARLSRDHRAWVLGDGGIARAGRAGRSGNREGVREALGLIEEGLALSHEGSDSWLRYSHTAGSVYCGLAASEPLPYRRTELHAKGIAHLEAAARQAGGPGHRLWAQSALALGRAYRVRARTGDRAEGRRYGLDALRGHAWAALLQSGTADAAEAARLATDMSLEVAAWCLADGVPAEAVQALDSCRGLVLHAATTSSSVPELLAAAGQHALADQWRATGAAADLVPSALRGKALAALTGDGAEGAGRLLDTPAPDEIGRALRGLGKDALVYLVPRSEDGGGVAVLVTSGGDVHAVPLPRLTEDAGPLRAYEPLARAARDLGPVPGWQAPEPPPGVPLRDQLDRLCSWAWYAAVRPLFDLFVVPDRPGRVPRLVLVPMGALGLVPWHAAWAPDASGARRHAIEEAEISYAASARLLCEVAARPRTPYSGTALVVGNPTGDLRYAGEEADAVRRVFYPEGRFLGLRTGDGTPDEVAAWLREGGDGGAVLHLACHAAVVESRSSSAYLSLKGGELAAERLTASLRGDLGLVVLAACRSHVSGRGHNEAYSLAAAFLVAGARSVVGSLWPVPDEATSVLMFMTHHYLRAEGEPPVRALRRAQLWMLDPARTVPPELPAVLAERVADIDPADLSAWAGFTHLGQ
ncbi:CHAT domain-containing protein [Streptomyces sp. NPDC059070]|uniref:CHAT domain-containing protein n=1 Tax=Streptomyces sp. NPDC059070 TaxID=3346713 RepID=UPI00369B5CEE